MNAPLILPPNPVFLINSMRRIGYTLETALADIIDNSISAKAERISIQYRWNNGNPWIAILDDGCGMSGDKLMEAMRFGSDSIRSSDDLGRFGLGLKTASLSQCRKLTVVSKQDGKLSALEWDVDTLSESDNCGWLVSAPFVDDLRAATPFAGLLEKLDGQNSGTLVIWRKIDSWCEDGEQRFSDRQFNKAMSVARDHVRLVFHRFISPDNENQMPVAIDFNNSVLGELDPFGSSYAACLPLTGDTIRYKGEKINVRPYLLPHHSKIPRHDYENLGNLGGEDGYLQNQGFYIYRAKRLISKGGWFRMFPRTEWTKLVRIRVDFPNTLDSFLQLDVKKSQVTPPKSILDKLKPFATSASEKAKRVVERKSAVVSGEIVPIWERKTGDARVSYTINENHPLARHLVTDGNGNIDFRKLRLLRVIGAAFPRDMFNADANNDKIEIEYAVGDSEQEKAVAEFVAKLRQNGDGEEAVRRLFATHQMPVGADVANKIISKEYHA